MEVDLSDFSDGEVRTGHTQDRKVEIGAILEDILQARAVTANQAESLRGRMHWLSQSLSEELLMGR